MITGKIQKVEESTDSRKNIIIYVNFYADGAIIVEGWKLYARFENFLGMTTDQISEWIRINVEYQIGNIIKSLHQTTINTDIMSIIESLTEVEYQSDKAEVVMDASKVITEPYTVTISETGTVKKATIDAEVK